MKFLHNMGPLNTKEKPVNLPLQFALTCMYEHVFYVYLNVVSVEPYYRVVSKVFDIM